MFGYPPFWIAILTYLTPFSLKSAYFSDSAYFLYDKKNMLDHNNLFQLKPIFRALFRNHDQTKEPGYEFITDLSVTLE